jgi:proline iminopeptidase
MQPLFPALKAYNTHRLPVTPPHELYIEECGNPDGIPILILHSGPGGGCNPEHRRFFDPELFRIILFDQRGSGRSTPHLELKDNTTQALMADIEALRQYLQIPRWHVFGAAWGSLLALYYAQHHPAQVSGMILQSVFLGRQKDIDWLYRCGANEIFPDYWQDFIKSFSDAEQEDIVAAYHARLHGSDELGRMATAKSWALWQARCGALQPHMALLEQYSEPHLALGLSYIETHYVLNRCFLGDYSILDNVTQIAHIPSYIIHGRYDMISPYSGAFELHQRWPNSEVFIIRDAGHALVEPGIIDAIIIAGTQIASSKPDETA